MSDIKLAVFDVDGTLVDSEYTIVRAMTEAWRRSDLGIPMPQDIRRIIGLSLTDACAALIPWAPRNTQRALAEAYSDAWRTFSFMPESIDPLFPGVVAALDKLEADGWILGIATGKSRRGLVSVLEGNDLSGRFMTMQTADDNPGKPHPAMLLRAAAAVGAHLERVIMIGDTAYDMEMAVAAKTKAVGVSWGYHTLDDLKGAGAQVILDSFDALPDTLESLLPKGK
jgi:phosphoglycolate phosphatase